MSPKSANAVTDRYDTEASFYDYLYDRTEDLPFYTELARSAKGPVLELACGTGRLAIPVARTGVDVTGLDMNKQMLTVFRRKLRRESLATKKHVHLVEGDMRHFQLERKFAFAFIAISSFLHNLTIEDEESCVRNVFEHLRPNGIFIVEVFNPDLSRSGRVVRLDKVIRHGDTTILRFPSQEMDTRKQIIDANLIYDFVQKSGAVRRKVVSFQLRYVFKDELVSLLEGAGFRVDAVYGNLDMVPFQTESPLIICVARKPT
jgi:SAM-dependent methyltransferase